MAPTPLSEFAAFVRICAQVGNDICWVQGGGGNASLKDGKSLWIKASGTWLAHALERHIFIPLSMPLVRSRLARQEDDCAQDAVLNNDPRRASIETFLHVLLPHRIVFHVHCVDTLRWAVREDGERQIAQRLAGLHCQWIPYRRPGAPLAAEVARRVEDGAPDILVLQNHGLVVGAQSPAAALALLKTVRARLAAPPRAVAAADPTQAAPQGYDWSRDPLLAPLAFDARARAVARKGVLYPDHAVFLGTIFCEVRDNENVAAALLRLQASVGAPPGYLVVPGQGLLVSRSLTPGALAMLQCLAQVTSRVGASEPIHALPEAEVAALLNWDAEIYRQKLAGLKA